MTGLPKGYLLRHASLADIPAAQRVLDDAESADCGEPRRHENRLEIDFRDPHLDLARDAWVVTAPAGSAAPLAAVALIWRPHPSGEIAADHYVHPEHRGCGLCEALLDTIEVRSAELATTLAAGVSATLVIWAEAETTGCRAALEARGFAVTRPYFEMRIDLGEELETPRWPDGITLRTLRVGRDEPQVHAAGEEAFAEHHMYEPCSYAEWRLRLIDRSDFDPGLWPIGWDGDEIAGYAAASVADDGGMVGDLAVRRPWRGRGLGLALLLEEFRALAARGVTVVRLFVDGQNATGAVALYEKAGMRVARRFGVLEKKLTAVGR
jgi:mycothiol synthase